MYDQKYRSVKLFVLGLLCMLFFFICYVRNGVGRTGVFLTVKSEMERMGAEGNVDVFHTVRQLRGSNHCMVYTEVIILTVLL